MGRYLIAAVLAYILPCLFTGVAQAAANPPDDPRVFGRFAPKTGVWSEYAIFDKATGRRSVMRLAIVGVENDAYWYEVMTRQGEDRNIVRMLITGDPHIAENVERLIIKSGKNAAREMPADSVRRIREMAGRMFEEQSGIPVTPRADMLNMKTGEGVVTVPAGTFDVSLHRIVDTSGRVYAEYKYSQEVRPFGIVTSDTDDTAMVLAGHGTDAGSLITEEPVMMDLPSDKSEELLKEILPDPMQPRNGTDGSQGGIRQIPGMGTGYEPKQ